MIMTSWRRSPRAQNPRHVTMRPMQACWIVLFILFTSAGMDSAKGVVEVDPSVVAVVCRDERQLEVICTTSNVLHTWQFIANPDSGVVTRLRQVSKFGSTGVESAPTIINSTIMFTFSRLSSQGSSGPLISRMTINPVSDGLNGSRVNCVDDASSESATTTILVIGDTPPAKLSIQSHSEQFLTERIVVMLEWTLSNSLSHYQPLLLPNVSINIVPDPEVEIVNFENMSVQLTLSYNILHNVSITQPGICEQPNQTALIELSYTKCYNPMAVRAINIIIEGYDDPALEGAIITFDCHDGLTLIGPNSSMCMNGEWEPDPRKANCTGTQTVVTSMTTNPMNPITPCGDQSESETPDPTTAMLRTALIAVICLSIMMSVLTFVIGFVCGHYFSRRWKKLAIRDQNKGNMSITTNERGEDLELKENVAYITLQPK